MVKKYFQEVINEPVLKKLLMLHVERHQLFSEPVCGYDVSAVDFLGIRQ